MGFESGGYGAVLGCRAEIVSEVRPDTLEEDWDDDSGSEVEVGWIRANP